MLYNHTLSNVPGFSVVTVMIEFPPGAALAPYRNSRASVSTVVLDGCVYNAFCSVPLLLLMRRARVRAWRQVVGPIKPGEFVAGDFETLAAYEHHKRVKPVVDALLDVHPSSADATRCVHTV